MTAHWGQPCGREEGERGRGGGSSACCLRSCVMLLSCPSARRRVAAQRCVVALRCVSSFLLLVWQLLVCFAPFSSIPLFLYSSIFSLLSPSATHFVCVIISFATLTQTCPHSPYSPFHPFSPLHMNTQLHIIQFLVTQFTQLNIHTIYSSHSFQGI